MLINNALRTCNRRLYETSRNKCVLSICHTVVRTWSPVFDTSVHCVPRRWLSYSEPRKNDLEQTAVGSPNDITTNAVDQFLRLPRYCPGCGAASQTTNSDDAGFYPLTRQSVKTFLADTTTSASGTQKDESKSERSTICDRCHNLLHHSSGVPIYHPSIQSIHDIIEQSPYKENHIYHVLDAADLPMSLIPSLQNDLRLPRLRTQNRRSKHVNYIRGRVAEVHFIVTRADLLAPKKDQVDSIMTYLRELLREALGRHGKNVRMGSLRCVSAKRGWWTKNLKEEIWNRGGAGWMVGKANVGKSSLYEVVFPKGRSLAASSKRSSNNEPIDALSQLDPASDEPEEIVEEDFLPSSDLAVLLPPARQETSYPFMPITSSLPGTTASPIRLSYGGGKGELIDLPGLPRSDLSSFVLPSHQNSLIMESRSVPERITIKPGQSLLLGGGLVRITPAKNSEDLVFLAWPFIPPGIGIHVTSTVKAEGINHQEDVVDDDSNPSGNKIGIEAIVAPHTWSEIKPVVFKKGHEGISGELKWDVTRSRTGPLTSKFGAKVKVEQLPFIVWSGDVVIEGVGWVEIVVQSRKYRQSSPASSTQSSIEFGTVRRKDYGKGRDALSSLEGTNVSDEKKWCPQINVYSPQGKFIMIRRPMNASLIGGKLDKKKTDKNGSGKGSGRPRKSMSSNKATIKGRLGNV